ncbi:MAG: excinuclease ABC subunit UvrA [Clostridiales bacterium]|nr:excinuclease ABC subunit UvrA [Clostridiales bacterium]
MRESIYVKGAKENNLKNIDVEIPRNKFVVLTGLSGSGKSSLAFDTIFAEGQRKYMESLSSYARQFLGQMQKPNVEYIEGLSPSISIDQKTKSNNPRSTVGTVTEIYDYFRLLYANVGVPHCPECGKEIQQVTIDQITEKIMAFSTGSRVIILAPIVRGKKGEHKKTLDQYRKEGYVRVKIDGKIVSIEEDIILDKTVKHDIYIVIDRLLVKDGMQRRLTDSVETSLKISGGMVVVDVEGQETLFSTKYACPDCEVSLPELTPRMFSFNSPYGACPSCLGLGVKMVVSPKKLIMDENLSLRGGALKINGWSLFEYPSLMRKTLRILSQKYHFSLDVPWKTLPENIKGMIMFGEPGYEKNITTYIKNEEEGLFSGFVNILEKRYLSTKSDGVKQDIQKYMDSQPCDLCGGKRLKKEVLYVTVGGRNISELCDMPIDLLHTFLNNLILSERQEIIARPILKEIMARLTFLSKVGLGYLNLSRSSGSLSGGESQRIRLATQIGSGLMGVIYILDEPSIGLHQRDNIRLLEALINLRNLGNTLIVVEHDEDTMRAADHIIDIGPLAGEKGGYLVAQGTVSDIMSCPNSITGDFLSGRRKIKIPSERRMPTNRFLSIIGANQNNLKNIDVDIPVGLFTVITGVSGSGKSSLISEILFPRASNALNQSELLEGKVNDITGLEYFDKVIDIDQSPIGRTPRSNPATYIDLFTPIRNLFAMTPDAKARGYSAGRFSFNVKGGRCENCEGGGIIQIEMHFLPDVYVPCEICEGKRYNRETLEVKYKGKSIYDVLDMTVENAVTFFENIPQIFRKVKCLYDVGLGYIKLGQPSTTLSGGEAQRIKLASELSKRSSGKTLYILDEPTTGLHAADVEKLLIMLQKLVDTGNTVVVIEHNLDVIKNADYIIDLGPEGGDAGGYVLAQGTPEQISNINSSSTGAFLKEVLQKELTTE